MTLLRGLRGSSGAGLRPKFFERTYVVEGDLLVVPSKRRRSPRPATPNGTPLSERHPHPTSQPPLRSGITDIPVCTGRNYRNRFGT